MTAPTDIIARLESATGSNFKLDWDIHRMFDPKHAERFDIPPNYTSSLDAAIALCERVLPGWAWRVTRKVNGDFSASMHGDIMRGEYAEGEHQSTPAIALTLAASRAMAAKEGE